MTDMRSTLVILSSYRIPMRLLALLLNVCLTTRYPTISGVNFEWQSMAKFCLIYSP